MTRKSPPYGNLPAATGLLREVRGWPRAYNEKLSFVLQFLVFFFGFGCFLCVVLVFGVFLGSLYLVYLSSLANSTVMRFLPMVSCPYSLSYARAESVGERNLMRANPLMVPKYGLLLSIFLGM